MKIQTLLLAIILYASIAGCANIDFDEGTQNNTSDLHSFYFSKKEEASTKRLSRNEINQCPNAPSLLTQIINKTIDFEKTPTIELLCNELRSENPDYLRCYSDCETRFANNFSNMK